MFTIAGKYTNASFVNHPAFTNPVAIMSDCHTGKGSCIGFTMKLTDKLIPAVVGVDIGCGLTSAKTTESEVSLEELERRIRKRVPFGQDVRETPAIHMRDQFPWHTAQVLSEKFARSYLGVYGTSRGVPHYSMDWLEERVDELGGNLRRVINSLGSAGSGNHFLEVGKDTHGNIWYTVHSGSRNLGKKVCEYWQERAIGRLRRSGKKERQEDIAKLKETYKGEELYKKIKELKEQPVSSVPYPDEQLWLEGEDAWGYLMDMIFCQVYATMNRNLIIKDMLEASDSVSTEQIETVHNYIDFRDMTIRKGAVRSYVGEQLLLPYNMRDGILLCEGKSCPDWNCSAPHGAGRVMSRSQAKKRVDIARFKEQMIGIYSTSVGRGTLDEAPDAYKDPKTIEEAIQPTVTILDRIKPLMNMKDSLGDNSDA